MKGFMVMNNKIRGYLIIYLYIFVATHLIIGMLLPWLKYFPILEPYHHAIEVSFWGSNIPLHVRELHLWWLGLFGATVQFASICMGLLVYIGDKYKLTLIWKWLIIGLFIWSPQDIIISLQYSIYSHVVMDIFVLLAVVPVLFWLNKIDR